MVNKIMQEAISASFENAKSFLENYIRIRIPFEKCSF